MKEKRESNESSDSEDDIWEYKSVKRVRKKPDFDEVSKSSNIAQTKMTVKRRGKSSLTQNTAEDTDSNTTVFKVTSKNKRNKAASKDGTIGDIVNGKDVKTKSSRTRLSVASMRSVGSSPSQQLQQTLHNHNNSKGVTSASTSKQRGGLSQKTSSQTSSRGGKGGTGRKSSTKKASQQTPQSKIPEKPKHEGSCPFCQMPFSVLTIESPRWHVTECMDLPLIATQECPGGVNCDSTIPGHFRKFRHTLLANVRAGLATETGEDPDDLEHRRFSRKLNFDIGTKTDTTATTKAATTTTTTNISQKSNNNQNCKSEDLKNIKVSSEATQVLHGNTCTQTVTVTNSNEPLARKVALKRKGSELTVDAVKKTLFQTPVKDDEQLDSDVTVKLEPTDDISILSKQPRLHDNNDDDENHKNKKTTSKKKTQEKRPLKSKANSGISEKNRVKHERPGRNSRRVDSDDVESDQDVFSDEYEDNLSKFKVGGVFTFDPNRNIWDMHKNRGISDMLADKNKNISDKLADPNRNISDMLATTTEDDSQGSDNDICDGTESSMAGEDEPGLTRVCDGTDSSFAGDDEPDVCDLTESEETNYTDVEETQDIDYLGHSLYRNTGATTVVKETQKMYPNNIDDGCDGDSANNTLVEAVRQVDKVEDDDDDDYDVVIVAAESINQDDITTPSRTKTRQYVSQAHAHSTSGLSTSGGDTSGGRTYRRRYRTSRLSRNRPSNNKNARLQNAASDSKQASVLDFFQPLWGKAKQAVETLTKAFSPPSEGSTTSTEQRSASSSRGVNDSDTGGATTSTCDESNDVEGATSTCSSVNSTVSDKAAAGNKPWPLKSQQTSKAGITPQYWTNKYNTGGASRGGGGDAGGGAGSRWGRGANKQCPFYKKMPGTPFTVDAFRYGSVLGCSAYFLSHFHYDHYGGLTKKFKHPVYCSKATANLVRSKLRVEEQYINALPMNQAVTVEGVKVTLLEANHCPGSVLFLFELPNGQTYLHTGDFRACAEMESYPQLIGRKIHQLYLDTTYCDPAYAFPPQKDVIRFAVNLVRDAVYENPNLLIVTGSYTIGKERIFMAIAEELNSKVCVTREKRAILECLEDPEIDRRMTLEKRDAKVHVLPMGWLGYEKLSEYLEGLKCKFDSILAISPTGWTHSNKTVSLDKIRPKLRRGNITVYGLPYSEHSSYTELKRFVQFTRADRVIATVNNGNPASRRKMDALFQSWLSEETPKKEAKQSRLTSWFK